MYLGTIDAIAEVCHAGNAVRAKKGFWSKVETLHRCIVRNDDARRESNLAKRKEAAFLKTRVEDLTRQLEHVARDRQAAIDGFQESVEENNKNMHDAIAERERIVSECNVKLATAQREIFLHEVRRDELACHRMFLMAQLSWYKKNFGPAKVNIRMDVTQEAPE